MQRMAMKSLSYLPDFPFTTHTHSGPNFTLHSKFNQQGPEHREEMAPIVFHIGKKAAELLPFTSEIKVPPIVGCYSKRNSLDGSCDKNVTLIRFRHAQTNEVIGLWI